MAEAFVTRRSGAGTRCARKLLFHSMTKTIYHVCPAESWTATGESGTYRGSDDDLRDGFIHFSTANQVKESVAKHRAGQNGLVILAVSTNALDRKSTRLNSSHVRISYAVFCLKKKNKTTTDRRGVRRGSSCLRLGNCFRLQRTHLSGIAEQGCAC